ncbi:MAG TPA: hypothetical protein DCS97_14290 [Planctomycetes bacterium]|nr:hypothetical protein [Planctomycetota bacterium]
MQLRGECKGCDALGRRIGKTVEGVTTLYLPAGAQTVVELTRPALPASQAALDGAESDGTPANAALTPASGGILTGGAGPVTRLNFQPATVATPAGFLADKGKTAGMRTNGLTYGWSSVLPWDLRNRAQWREAVG